jgi:hypothetical protein
VIFDPVKRVKDVWRACSIRSKLFSFLSAVGSSPPGPTIFVPAEFPAQFLVNGKPENLILAQGT